MGVNKVEFGDDTIIDISDSTVDTNNLMEGVVAYGADGERIVGSATSTTYTEGDGINISDDNVISTETRVIDILNADYEALTDAQKMDPSIYYNITDLDTVAADIDDTKISSSSVWSSQKVNNSLPVGDGTTVNITNGVVGLTNSVTQKLSELDKVNTLKNYTDNLHLNGDGVEEYDARYIFSDFIPVNGGESVKWVNGSASSGARLGLYDADKNYYDYWGYNTENRVITLDSNARYIRTSFATDYKPTYGLIVDGKYIYSPWSADANNQVKITEELSTISESHINAQVTLYQNKIYKKNGIVTTHLEISGTQTPISANTSVVLGYLPIGYRPLYRVSYAVVDMNGSTGVPIGYGTVTIETNGTMSLMLSNSLDFVFMDFTFIAQ